ncbi:uncharacterized protein [Ptychodera flava]|uniref:uncharacterized protein n=1 Tax=Ptychodera flava TaxID=63121 RepID=UPI00396A931C
MDMRPLVLVLIIGCSLCGLTGSSSEPEFKYTNKDGWVDPGDMMNYDSNTKTMRNTAKEKDCEKFEERLTKCTGERDRFESEVKECTKKLGSVKTKECNCEPSCPDKKDTRNVGKELTKCIGERDGFESEIKRCNQELHLEKTKECKCERSCPSTKDDVGKEKGKSNDKKAQCEAPYFKQFVRSILNQMSAKKGGDEHLQFEYQVQLTQTDWSTLDEFIHSDSGNIYDAHHVLIGMVKRVDTSDKPISNWKIWLEDLFGTDYNTIVMTSLFGLGVLTFVLIMVSSEVMSRISWWKLITRGFFFLFVISIPWNWLHMYKLAVVKKYSVGLNDIPAECQPGGSTVYSGIAAWFYSTFTFSGDQCAQYHEALMVDPVLEVPPTQALVVTFSKFVFKPLEHLGEAMGKFFNSFYKDLPVHVWPIATLILVIVIILVLIMLCGYNIKFPLYGGIEAPRQQTRRLTKSEQRSIENAKQQKKKIQEIETQNKELVKKIEELEETAEKRDQELLMLKQAEKQEPLMLEMPPLDDVRRPVQAEEDHNERSVVTEIQDLKEIRETYTKCSPTGTSDAALGSGAAKANTGSTRLKKRVIFKEPVDIQDSFKILGPQAEVEDGLAPESDLQLTTGVREGGVATGQTAPSVVQDNIEGAAERSPARQQQPGHTGVEDIDMKANKTDTEKPGSDSTSEERTFRSTDRSDKGDGDAAAVQHSSQDRVEEVPTEGEQADAQDRNEGAVAMVTDETERPTQGTTTREGAPRPDLLPDSAVLTESTEVIPRGIMDTMREVEILESFHSRGNDSESEQSEDEFVVLNKEGMETESVPGESENGENIVDASVISLD